MYEDYQSYPRATNATSGVKFSDFIIYADKSAIMA